MSAESWKLTAFASRTRVKAALDAHERVEEWDPQLAIAGRELGETRPDEWVLEAWYPLQPGPAQTRAIAALFDADPPPLTIEPLAQCDWLALSQAGLEPIAAGRFYVRTPDHAPSQTHENLVIPASQAFGTGQHATTSGCLEMLDRLAQNNPDQSKPAQSNPDQHNPAPQRIIDVGTGTGLLAFAALRLWPHAVVSASDIDPVCMQVVAANAALNGVRLGCGEGALTMVQADGMDSEVLQARAPYDLIIANILAQPLIAMARDLTASLAPGGHVILAGLLREQERGVVEAYGAQGLHLEERLVDGEWSILRLHRAAI